MWLVGGVGSSRGFVSTSGHEAGEAGEAGREEVVTPELLLDEA